MWFLSEFSIMPVKVGMKKKVSFKIYIKINLENEIIYINDIQSKHGWKFVPLSLSSLQDTQFT